jgi:hypothetical protein
MPQTDPRPDGGIICRNAAILPAIPPRIAGEIGPA